MYCYLCCISITLLVFGSYVKSYVALYRKERVVTLGTKTCTLSTMPRSQAYWYGSQSAYSTVVTALHHKLEQSYQCNQHININSLCIAL